MKTGFVGLAAALSGAAFFGAAHAAPMRVEATSTVSAVSPSDTVKFEVYLPLRNSGVLDALLKAQQTPGSSDYHKWLSPAQFGAQFGPTAQAMADTAASLKAQGLTVTATHTRSLTVMGGADVVQRAFGLVLSKVRSSAGVSRYVAANAPVLPATLKVQGAVLVAFAGKPLLHSNARLVAKADPENRSSASGAYWFTDLKQAYDYPSYQAQVGGQPLDGSGVSVAVLISNDALDSDIAKVFDHEKFTALTNKPAPHIIHHPINGGAPFDSNASVEASLDVQQVLGGAPGAQVTLVNIPNLSDQNILDGYLYIVESNQYDVVNSSFGGCELAYSAAFNGGQDFYGLLDVYDTIFKQGNAQGVTFVASSGDEGGLECPDVNYFYGTGPARFTPSVSFPADSPHVTAVGGGNLLTVTGQGLNSAYVQENALGDPEISYDPYGFGATVAGGFWGAGGGFSDHFARPDYQTLVATGSAMRTLPDIGMQVGGCPGGISLTPCGPNRSYVAVAVQGASASGFVGLIGTSVSSPEFVGAIALYLQKTGSRAGNLNTYLYSQGAAQTAGGARGYHHVVAGFDGKWTDKSPNGGYNYLVGNGTPDVRELFGLSEFAAAGTPQTASNP